MAERQQVQKATPEVLKAAWRQLYPPQGRSLLVEWSLGGSTPRECWLTNMNKRPIAELVALAMTLPQARRDLDELTQSVGLGHHEGRSFIGWHHHVTLVSLAHAFRVLETLRETRSNDFFVKP